MRGPWSPFALMVTAGCAQGDTQFRAPDRDQYTLQDTDDAEDPEVATECGPPDVLVLLDRSDTMRARPDGEIPPSDGLAQSRWSVAIEGIERFTHDLGDEAHVGVALFPRDPGQGCRTVPQLLFDEPAPSNPTCQPAELLVDLVTGTALDVASSLDPTTTRVCASAPLAQAIADMSAPLSAAAPDRRHLVIVTDGDAMCLGDPVAATHDLVAHTGAIVHVIALSDALLPVLDDLACAGGASLGFPDGCVESSDGRWVADAPGSDAARYHVARDADELMSVFAVLRDELATCE